MSRNSSRRCALPVELSDVDMDDDDCTELTFTWKANLAQNTAENTSLYFLVVFLAGHCK